MTSYKTISENLSLLLEVQLLHNAANAVVQGLFCAGLAELRNFMFTRTKEQELTFQDVSSLQLPVEVCKCHVFS